MVDFKLGTLLSIFIAIIVGLVLFTPISTQVDDITNPTGLRVNESIALVGQDGTTAQDAVLGVSFFGNATVSTNTPGVGIQTEINFTSNGTITTFANFTDGDYFISYTFTPDDFVDDSPSRSVLRLVLIFFALGILAIAILTFRRMGEGVL